MVGRASRANKIYIRTMDSQERRRAEAWVTFIVVGAVYVVGVITGMAISGLLSFTQSLW